MTPRPVDLPDSDECSARPLPRFPGYPDRKAGAELCRILSGITATQTSRDDAAARTARWHYLLQISVEIRSLNAPQ
jgi:hypothetical protein